ncbi:hypothetical protein BDFG_06905 [Blastomyces dermatitidis ATCC 26199]|nr:hypothetical protein BDFG_06905 [Blastomyces dermatitidis ATCC 26199]
MQLTGKFMALALLLAPLALTSPTEDMNASAQCTPGTYRCKCVAGSTYCAVDVCNALGRWQLSAVCRRKSSPGAPATCRDGPNGTAYCI